MTPLEQTMLRGVSVKLMFTIIGATVAICGTFLGTYYNFSNKLSNSIEHGNMQDKIIMDIQNTQRSFENKIQVQQLQLNTHEVRMNEMDKRLNK